MEWGRKNGIFGDVYSAFSGNQVAVAFLIIALGYAIGGFEFRGITLGSSCVLIIALLFGHFGFTIPSALGAQLLVMLL